MMSDPDPTEVIPTTRPPSAPTAIVAPGRTTSGPRSPAGASAPPPRARLRCRRVKKARTTMVLTARSSAPPRAILTWFWTASPSPKERMTRTPAKAAGTEPAASQPTRLRLTVPCRRWTAPPIGFITKAATRSDDTAASGWILKNRTRIGVIRAPPPMPVSPTVNPTTSPARATHPSTWSIASANDAGLSAGWPTPEPVLKRPAAAGRQLQPPDRPRPAAVQPPFRRSGDGLLARHRRRVPRPAGVRPRGAGAGPRARPGPRGDPGVLRHAGHPIATRPRRRRRPGPPDPWIAARGGAAGRPASGPLVPRRPGRRSPAQRQGPHCRVLRPFDPGPVRAVPGGPVRRRASGEAGHSPLPAPAAARTGPDPRSRLGGRRRTGVTVPGAGLPRRAATGRARPLRPSRRARRQSGVDHPVPGASALF